MLEVVKEVYFPFLDEQSVKAPPGKVTLIAVSADEPAGKPVVDCEKQSVCLTIHRGPEDDRILQGQGVAGFRQARILDFCQEALSQGALLTREDLAYRVFFVSTRTITRDLNVLREINPDVMILSKYERQNKTLIPRRGTIHDAGNSLSHKRIICHKRYVEGKSADQIARETYHSLEAVDRYLEQFDRVRHCLQQGIDTAEILRL